MFLSIGLIIIGLMVLIFGAEVLVRGSASLARRMGISPLVIGLTVVAFGTSTPELVVNIFSAIKGSSDIAIGNIIGSNIANILLIVGLSAAIFPLHVKRSTIWKEIPFALLAVILLFIMANDELFDKIPMNALTRTDGLALMSMFIIFLFYIYGLIKNTDETPIIEEVKTYSYPRSIFFVVSGLLALFLGGKLLVDNALILARLAGLSETLIGLTIVAVGTSLPELATSVVAAIHKQDDIAVGNIVGSNIFNVFWILGLTSTILPLPFNNEANKDIFVSILATLLLFLSLFIGKKREVERWQGVLFLISYIGYLAYIIYRG